jgi:LmbE family N-acetylglucosaminyl deacetylase
MPAVRQFRRHKYASRSLKNVPIETTLKSDLLARIVAPERPTIREKTVLIVAHPGDETLACAGLLPRLADVCVLHVTDGAPRNSGDARRHGFTHWADYARARRKELESAAAIAGIPAAAMKSLGVPDQGAAMQLAMLTRAMLGFIAGAELVLTHAYEGGHPDHDAVAFAVAAARARMRGRAPLVLELPLYRHDSTLAADGAAGPGVALHLTQEERARKARMLAEFATQQEALVGFGVRDEIYRIAPAHDFTQPPTEALYDSYDWGITGGRFAQLARAARGELGLDSLRP